jgi:hypothetical protein
MLDEHKDANRQTLTAAATEVFHAGFRVLAAQRAALQSFDQPTDDDDEPPPVPPGRYPCAVENAGALSGSGYGPFGGAA